MFLKEYEHILMQRKKGRKYFFITGDFNCKIGDKIEGNKTEITKSGKIFKQMILEHNLKIVNSSRKNLKGYGQE